MKKVFGLIFLTSLLIGVCIMLRVRTGSIVYSALAGGICGAGIMLAYIWGTEDG